MPNHFEDGDVELVGEEEICTCCMGLPWLTIRRFINELGMPVKLGNPPTALFRELEEWVFDRHLKGGHWTEQLPPRDFLRGPKGRG
jgi:hypothetical protein